jgi:tetratricopeptide (TPR) repeat protein
MFNVLRVFAFLLTVAATVVGVARADQTDPRLGGLFNQLEIARTEPEIRSLMRQIGDIWNHSGSDSIDLLMARAQEAQSKAAPLVAIDILDEVVDLVPRYAEGWCLRGMVNAAEGNDEEALSDLREALRLEPRHFGALDQIGRLMETQDDTVGAVEVYKRLLEIIPQYDGLRLRLKKLETPVPAAPPI